MKVEVRRPETLKWIMLIAIAILFVMTLFAALNIIRTDLVPGLLLVLIAATFGWFGQALFLTKASAVVLEDDRLVDDSGVELCRLDDIEELEKGLHLFKPSSGFVVKLKTKQPAAWSPGLWWRIGHRVGVGGATPGRRAKAMADAILMVQNTEAAQQAIAEIEKHKNKRKNP